MNIKKISVFILIVLSIILMFLFVSCEKKNDSPINSSPDEQTQKTEDLTLSVVSADMIFGDELNIICFYGGDNSVEWVSSDNSVAVVDDDGTVNAVGVGSCDITAKAGSASASCKVTVSMGDYLPELKVLHISDDGLNLRVGDEFEPEIKVLTPSDTKIEKTPEIKVTQEVAASIEENVNTVANNIENKDTTSKIKDKAVAQMTAMEDKNTVVTKTTVQQESSSNQQNNNNLTQNNAQEQVVKMSMESNTGSSNVQINGLETFVSKMDAQLSAASNASSSMQNTLNTNSIMEQVNKQFEQLQQSASNKVSIVLQPENLGRVSVEIMNTKDGITAKMMTDSQQVKDLFDKNIEALKSNLSAQGVNVNNIKVECTQESANNAMNFEREQFNQSFNNPNNSNHNQTNQPDTQTVYANTDNMNFDEVETDINSGVEIKNTQTIIQHNGKVDYKV